MESLSSLKRGKRVKVTFAGTVVQSKIAEFAVKRDNTSTVSYFTKEEFDGLEVDILKPVFDPKPGQVYTVKFSNSSVESPWFVTRKMGETKMVSAAGVFSLESFISAYVEDDSCTVAKVNFPWEEKSV